jgi:hypothetical protein
LNDFNGDFELKKRIIPIFVGMLGSIIFGIMDNGIMILAGAEIDAYIRSLGLDTMTSAGIGNTISDGVGVAAGGTVMKILNNKFESINTPTTFQEFAGIIIGCLIPVIIYILFII